MENMSEVESIRNFIMSSERETEESAPSEQRSTSEAQQSSEASSEQQSRSMLPPKEDYKVYGSVEFKLADTTTEKEYKKYLNNINKLKKNLKFPCVFQSQVINNEDELNITRRNMMQQMKVIRSKQKNDNVKKTKMKLEDLPEVTDESELAEDGDVFYNTKTITAVRDSNGKVRRVPSTNKKDRRKLYEALKSDKKLLMELIEEIDPELFKSKSNEHVPDDLKPMLNAHMNNNINRDDTWTRESLISFLKGEMKRQQNKPRMSIRPSPQQPQPQPGMPFGFNPALLK